MQQYEVPAMSCEHCVRVITETIRSLDPGAQVSADLPSHSVKVETEQPRLAVIAALAEAGYPPA